MLGGEVELDDAFIGATGNGKHGRGTDQQQLIVAVETGRRRGGNVKFLSQIDS